METSTLYYFYSTIAQTLAGLIGLLGAFTILRLSDIEGRVNRPLNTLDGQTSDKAKFRVLRAAGNMVELLKHLDSELAGLPSTAKDAFAQPLEELRRAGDAKQGLYSAAKTALVRSGVAITLALVGILATELMKGWGGGCMLAGHSLRQPCS